MKYRSSLTNKIKLTIFIIFCYWIIIFLYSFKQSSIKDIIIMSLGILSFGIIYILFLVKGIYIVIEDNSVKYVHMFFIRKSVEVEKINKIQKGIMGGLYTSLLLTYNKNGKMENIKIATLTFKKDTLKQFVLDLKKINPLIEVDQSVMDYK